MNLRKRQARAKRRAKSMRLVKRGVPHTCSKWSIHGTDWIGKSDGMQPREVQSIKKRLGTKRHAADLSEYQ